MQRALAHLHTQQPLNAITGATHAAAWAHVDGRIVLLREDVGRHNALDKLIGAMARAGEEIGVNLAVSLHAVNKDVRDEIVRVRAEAAARKGWMFDTYLLRRR